MVGNKIVEKEAIPLGKYPTVFQAELMALFRITEILLPRVQQNQGKITMFCDSQAVLRVLNKELVNSKLVFAAMQRLDELALANKPYQVELVRGQAGHLGKDVDNTLAREGAKMIPQEPEPIVPVPGNQLMTAVNAEVDKKWNRRWRFLPTARQSRRLWPVVNEQRSLHLAQAERQDYGEMVRLLTGHNHLNRHAFLLGKSQTAECRLCLEAEEMSEHLLCECPALNDIRQQILGQRQIEAEALGLMPLDGLRRFILLIRRRLNDEGLEKI